eukprot:symbB.v1.2.035334.t1/scaffold4678.1/size36577/1
MGVLGKNGIVKSVRFHPGDDKARQICVVNVHEGPEVSLPGASLTVVEDDESDKESVDKGSDEEEEEEEEAGHSPRTAYLWALGAMTVNDTKAAIRSFRACVKEKGASACIGERKAAVEGVSSAVKSECSAHVEDFFSCFAHRYELSSCGDATVSKMIKCQEQFSGQLLGSK